MTNISIKWAAITNKQRFEIKVESSTFIKISFIRFIRYQNRQKRQA